MVAIFPQIYLAEAAKYVKKQDQTRGENNDVNQARYGVRLIRRLGQMEQLETGGDSNQGLLRGH